MIFSKLLDKLYEYNEKMNRGGEISLIDFYSRVDPMESFAKTYDA